ncbi:MAG: hypothetical protein QHC78_07430 [Pigmentiphaga sp.]|uniref:COG4315 family predicted lipoprotein n=1 Tax=Pigmentiphaga sp. TaxID=1977564 RepID=UPI0029BC469D|nr:hypothetical protein [Pigmentiphaga sp.]MDX3905505.1 hypothetical protein [Pigmentiphaga sp.]
MVRALVYAACASALLAAGCSSLAVREPARVSDGALVAPNGMSLYTFDRDPVGQSVCNGMCAQNWPPLTAPADATRSGDWMVINRQDGSRQWAYRGKPLYFWVKDRVPGDRTGDGFNGVWRLARP